ncbi:hypothetical protein DMH04_23155 [Kibdelosporangium aridum]|uniref:Uncharacterized protein n=1 Tax=Kibdelosporangium aridum TaxID=2030 RepID=A0A428Z7C7_KIBAR|nr:hypothetical protein [Kibdelosporangium aridum]RSM83544.1 hypothetical protein DMH04_23155 [Kibdelosporangium aridum]
MATTNRTNTNIAAYARSEADDPVKFEFGESLVGQAAVDKRIQWAHADPWEPNQRWAANSNA